ncbi:hypothetical protein CSUNSWCD_1107 [Campylobacter showae CSUNSWCD]|uniref:Uncharacterized protein n=1 Tax=Campylobacter showae CSUNSWCD TaxID=1244083 RepID=M5IHC8_9BACT|nr:hypothetical protein CSUNSWCD_1107 [Campylobacter showae CSUNSWCD]
MAFKFSQICLDFNPPKFTPAFFKFPFQFHSNLTALWLIFRKFDLRDKFEQTRT